MEAIIYRSFTAADAETVQALARETWRYAYPHLFTPEFIDAYIIRVNPLQRTLAFDTDPRESA